MWRYECLEVKILKNVESKNQSLIKAGTHGGGEGEGKREGEGEGEGWEKGTRFIRRCEMIMEMR